MRSRRGRRRREYHQGRRGDGGVEGSGGAEGREVEPAVGERRRLTCVAHEADPVAPGPELLGDADGGRHVATAVPGHEQDVRHVSPPLLRG